MNEIDGEFKLSSAETEAELIRLKGVMLGALKRERIFYWVNQFLGLANTAFLILNLILMNPLGIINAVAIYLCAKSAVKLENEMNESKNLITACDVMLEMTRVKRESETGESNV